MRQLGAHLPVPPPVETDVETPSAERPVERSPETLPHERYGVESRGSFYEPFPVEVYRIENHLIEPAPAAPQQKTQTAEVHPGPLPALGPLPDAVAPQQAQATKAPPNPLPVPDPLPEPVAPPPQKTQTAEVHLEPLPASGPLPEPVPEPAEEPLPQFAERLRIMEVSGTHPGPVPEPVRTLPDPRPDSADRPPATAPKKLSNPVVEPALSHSGALPNPRPLPEARTLPEERAAPIGRWEEFHDFRRLEPGRDARISLEPVAMQQGAPSRLLSADLEGEHRSSFLTLAVPGIAAILAVGALLWSGSLRDRVREQDATMSALQEQNQKLADTLAEMNVEQKASSALDSGSNAPSAHVAATPRQAPAPVAQPAQVGQPATPSASTAVPKNPVSQTVPRQGVSAPPPVQGARITAQQKGSRYQQPVEAGYAPEIVPPYPTNFKSNNVAANAANSQPVPSAGAYREPFTPGAYQEPVSVAGSNRSATASARTAPRGTVAQAPAASGQSSSPAVNNSASEPTSYSATGNGSYASALAQNIESVEGLQRHSAVPLREFHMRAGMSTQATPNVRLSVQHPDQGRGSYALVVNDGGSSYQLRGQLNQALVFNDTATHRQYALVVLNIADQQVYGYLRTMQ